MQPKPSRGFSLIELMVVVTTIGLVALIAIPAIHQAADRTEVTAAANDIRVFTEAVEFFSTTKGNYPVSMNYSSMPDEISDYLPALWKNANYSWVYVNTTGYTFLYVYNLNYTAEQSLQLDRIIDDGNLGTGDVRTAGTGIVFYFNYQST